MKHYLLFTLYMIPSFGCCVDIEMCEEEITLEIPDDDIDQTTFDDDIPTGEEISSLDDID